MRRCCAKNAAAWGYRLRPAPSMESLTRLQQVVVIEGLRYLHYNCERENATFELIKAEYDGERPGDHQNTLPHARRMLDRMLGVSENINIQGLSGGGALWLDEMIKLLGPTGATNAARAAVAKLSAGESAFGGKSGQGERLW